MVTMDVKGVTWVGNVYQKFENMCLEVEEDTVKYIENHLQTVGESVKKFYSDVMQDLLPLSSCDLDEKVASELPIDQYADAGFCQKSFQGSKETPVKAKTKPTTEDSRIHHVDNYGTHAASYDGSCETDSSLMSASRNPVRGSNFISRSTQHVGSVDIKSNLSIDEDQKNKKKALTKIFDEITLAETDACRTSQSCELSNENQIDEVAVSKPASAEVTTRASVTDCCNEIENGSTEQFPNVPVSVLFKSAKEKERNMGSSSSGVLFGEPDGFSMDRTIQFDDCSYNTIRLSHSEIPDDVMKSDSVKEPGHKTRQQDDKPKLEESCVMVIGDELKLVPKAGVNLKTNKKKMRKAFSLCKKSARKQEYRELAVWHQNSEKGKGDCMENLDETLLVDQKKLLLPNISESEWELL